MKYSIVIPAYNESDNIGNSIKCLERQNIPRSEFEIVVVDNNSSDNTHQVALNAGADVVVKELKMGTNLARQCGFEKAKGEIVAFLDADCEPPSDWLERIAIDLSKKDVAAVSGPYDYGFKGLASVVMDYIYFQYIAYYAPLILGFLFRRKAGIITGGNFAAKREVIKAIGGLPPLTFWGDDSATAMLISRRVGKVFFDADLIVKSSARRFEKAGFLKMSYLYAIAYLKVFFSKEFI